MEGITTREQAEATSTERPFLHVMPDEDDINANDIQYRQLKAKRNDARWRENIIALLNGDE